MNLKIEVKSDKGHPSSWKASIVVEDIELGDLDLINKIPELVKKQAEEIIKQQQA